MSPRARPEPVQGIKTRRDAALRSLVAGVPYIGFLGITFDRRGDELTAVLPFDDRLSWTLMWEAMEAGRMEPGAALPDLPKTIDFTVDYLRSGLPRDAYARARVNRSGRRYASVHVEAWQDNRSRLFAQGTGHFLMPETDGT